MSESFCSGGFSGCGSGKSEAGCQGSGCGACCSRGELLLCREEIVLLLALGQYAFLPVLTTYAGGEPRYAPIPEDATYFAANFSDLLLSLERKGLISLDSDMPLTNADYGKERSASTTLCGSIALTMRGQEVLDWVNLEKLDSE